MNPNTLPLLSDYIAEQTEIPMAVWAWAHAPAGTYGTVTGDQDSTFFAGGNAERATRGYVDVFCRSDGFAEKALVETALQASGWHWFHNSTQFEEETGIIHHAWSVAWLG